MRIISKFYDYYDSVAHMYGGGDPKIVYERVDIIDPHTIFGCQLHGSVCFDLRSELEDSRVFGLHRPTWNIPRSGRWADYKGSYLCVAGRMFLLIGRLGDIVPSFYTAVNGAEEYINEYLEHQSGTRRAAIHHQFNGTKEFPELITICQKVKAPVFRFNFWQVSNGVNTFQVLGKVPQLSKLRIAKHYSAQSIYQDLSYFMGNTINGSPDVDPPVTIDDKCRIQQHGFDLKTSFRGTNNR